MIVAENVTCHLHKFLLGAFWKFTNWNIDEKHEIYLSLILVQLVSPEQYALLPRLLILNAFFGDKQIAPTSSSSHID